MSYPLCFIKQQKNKAKKEVAITYMGIKIKILLIKPKYNIFQPSPPDAPDLPLDEPRRLNGALIASGFISNKLNTN
ncbi:hypothetical protein HMPREF2130_01470 [Oligella urethralis DNF00040]|uniref:Uncharacterized protein n=1 Tax=Oligella urethralis DNF00040 TaxID=1401065 RepID=A0A096BG99_9BURK|nr:hypothetical protein HMPREF2130_01470 [Oligella urethralis DNF00040]